MTEFDEERALREEIQGLSNVLMTLSVQTKHAERIAAEATAQYDALLKLQAFAEGELKRKHAVLFRLIASRSEKS